MGTFSFLHTRQGNPKKPDPAHRPEVWGGVEPTVNRVGDIYLDQLEYSGHATRIEDLDRFADLGIKAIRYPVLWEKIAPDGVEHADWSWPDARLARLRRLGIRPIVGLVHHGSGPRHTSLLDPAFPEELAAYAGAVARRYPWIEDYTPVNEPLTTARFSALYGHWYPHERSDESFARALVGQCRAVVLAMRAIREVNPRARLVQTDDVGTVHSTPKLAYQAEFENERRWLTFDLLTGQLTPEQRTWEWLLHAGIERHELEWFQANPCLPDVFGINYYLRSERFLDQRLKRYPGERVGGNGVHRYVDICAARVLPEPIIGVEALLRQAWDRYGIPISITEVHNGSTREEQLRWLHEVWHHAVRARSCGIDVCAITVWALLGSYDWNSLVTENRGEYEPGVFDLRGSEPRPTALARMTRDLAVHGEHDHPVNDVPGWWRRPDRVTPYASVAKSSRHRRAAETNPDKTDRRSILIVPGPDAITSALVAACAARHIPAVVTDALGIDGIEHRLAMGDIWAIVVAGISDTDAGEAGYLDALSGAASRSGIPCLRFATQPAMSHDRDIAAAGSMLELVVDGDAIRIPDAMDPLHLHNMAHTGLDLLIDDERGSWRLASTGDGVWQVMPIGDNASWPDLDAADD